MLERGLLATFSDAVTTEVQRIQAAGDQADDDGPGIRDLTGLLWASIDNDDSRDLDQLTVADVRPGETVKILVAVADVDAFVKDDSAIDAHARHNTTSVYTAAMIFPMLPPQLSTDLTSLNPGEDRLSLVVEMVIDAAGALQTSDIYRARVRNHAQLAYDGIAAWLEQRGPLPAAAARVPGLDDNLRAQDAVAQRLRQLRHQHGALNLETLRAKPRFDGDRLQGLDVERKNRATELIEDFMIAANSATAAFLEGRGVPSLRRMVRSPKRWPRLVELAERYGGSLPAEPDSVALAAFLDERRAADRDRFPELSLTVVKLLGPGEYVVDLPGQPAPGHFGLAVRDYTHATAPNRRFPDLITQRLLKAVLAGRPCPYPTEELAALALHCTQSEDAANKVERQVSKSAAALLLEPRVGQSFDGIVTGASEKGTWVRIFHPLVEGRVERGAQGLDVGDKVRVRLASTDVERGFIDFVR
jgi:exoribonuclease-2